MMLLRAIPMPFSDGSRGNKCFLQVVFPLPFISYVNPGISCNQAFEMRNLWRKCLLLNQEN